MALRRWALLLACAASIPLGHAGYMSAKAEFAQVLLTRAWNHRLGTGQASKPWPWADTEPVARLRVARLDIDASVLSGDSGRTLAFGPGWTESSAMPGAHGLSVISAHRDTHFTFLRDLVAGDALTLETPHGIHRFEVATLQIVDARTERIDTMSDADALLLVTCYPFDALDAGGPLRYVVHAARIDSAL
jgi:sortase A